MEKFTLHEKPFINSSEIHIQSVSTDKSEGILFANAYGKTKKEAIERAKLISVSNEMHKELKLIFDNYDKGTDTYKRLENIFNQLK